MWGLGCLVWEVYNGPLRQASSLRNTSKVSVNHKHDKHSRITQPTRKNRSSGLGMQTVTMYLALHAGLAQGVVT